jgi:hypothetical protein
MGRILCIVVCALRLCGQQAELRIYSEFDRLNTSGELIDAVPGRTPQEIISPAVARNAFTSFHVAVTGRPGILYWFAIQSNPPNAFGIRLYKELPPAGSSILDELREEQKPSYFLAVMPASGAEVYLLDIWTPADAPVRTVRLEVLVKEAYWVVAPMEVRVQRATVPPLDPQVCCVSLPSADHPSASFAWEALWKGFTGARLPFIPAPANVRAAIRRNAVQDAALIRSLPVFQRDMLLDRLLFDTMQSSTPGSYPTVRRLIYKLASN